MNALYAGEDGAVFDYFGGLEDLPRGVVRFVGDATTRIREDYLRHPQAVPFSRLVWTW